MIIWTDCDREGENIGFEIIQVCTAKNPHLRIYRAKFSEITSMAVRRAMENLAQPDERISKAVDVRSELDLRIGKFRSQPDYCRSAQPSAFFNGLVLGVLQELPSLAFRQ